ncbi:transmembrane protein, putative, partial [Rhizoctonia solani AG-3 Rhs1AP]
MCLNDNEDMWVPCTSVTRTFDTDTSTQTITETSDTSPILITLTSTLRSHTSHTRLQQTILPTITSAETDESTLTVKSTRAEETKTHTSTPTGTPRPLSATSARTPTSSKSLGSSLVVEPSSTREHTSTREVDPSTRGAATVHSTHFESSHPTHTSTRLVSPPLQSILTSSFVIPTPFVVPSPSSTVSPTPAGIQGGALAGVIVGTILGVVGLLGLGAFIMKSLSGRRSHDLFEPRGGYQAASSGGSFGGRDNSGSGVEGRGAGGMSEAQTGSPLRSALRNQNMAGGGGGWSDASWNQAYAYTGVAVAAAAVATTANNQRGRHSGANERYADGGIHDGDTPDALPRRYADSGLGGPDSHYDTGISNHPYGNQDLRDIVSNSETQFDPYHDLPVRQDSVPVGGNITRHSAFTTTDVSLSPPGPTASYHSTPGSFITGHPVSTMHPPHTGVFLSTADGLSTTSFVASSINQPVQPPAPSNAYPNSAPYAYTGNSGAGGVAYQSPEPLTHSDIQRPPYWEGSVAAASVDSLPQHGNIPRYSAFTDAGNILSIGGSPYTSGIGSAPAPVVGGVVGEGVASQGPAAVTPTWNPVGVTEFGQNTIGSFSVQVDATAHISGSAAPDAPRNLHQGLTRLSTELASAEGRDIDAWSPRSASRASARPPRVGGPRMKPPRTPSSMSRLDSRRSLPPAYEERQGDF